MKTLDELPLSAILRFGLTGFVGIALFGLIPVVVFAPTVLTAVAGVGGAVGTVALAFTTGFIIDGLKLYQLSPGYSRRKEDFMRAIGSALGVTPEEATIYFAKAAQVERSQGLGHIDFVHSRWVAFDIFAKLFLGAASLWGTVAMVLWAFGQSVTQRSVLSILAVTFFLVALRLFQTARQERLRVEKLYIEFCARHAIEILGPDMKHRMAVSG